MRLRRRTLLSLLAFAAWPLAASAAVPAQPPRAPAGNNAVAQVLAGIAPAPGNPEFDRLVATPEWQSHREWVQRQWAEVRRRLDAMAAWRDAELRIADADRRTLIYPFSGPDFLNADALFPTHPKQVFFSLERPGTLPDVTRLSTPQFARALKDVRDALGDIFERNYFITDYMTRQLTTPYVQGTVPVIAVMMALTGHRIASIEPFTVFPHLSPDAVSGEPRAPGHRPRKPLRSVRIVYAKDGGPMRTLEYHSIDATDRQLRWYPEFLDHVGSNQPATAFLKSASYLLHDNQFAGTRAMLMKSADIIVQDDTGIPFRQFQGAGWSVRLFGVYTPPLQELRYGAQPDLEAAYVKSGQTRPLAFPFGYHGKDGRSALMVAQRPR
jgi:hypothetical protein